MKKYEVAIDVLELQLSKERLEQEKQAQLKQKNKLNILNSENKNYYNSTKSQNDYNSKEFRKQQLEDCGDLKPQSWSTGWSPDRDE